MPHYDVGRGEFRIAYHVDMVTDDVRVNALALALRSAISPGMQVLDCGSGSGLLAIIAARFGATVCALEVDESLMPILSENIEKSGLPIEIWGGDLFELTKCDRNFDLAIIEMMSIWCVDEPQVLASNFVRENLLETGGAVIPSKIINLASLAYFRFGNDFVEVAAPFAKFTGVPDAQVFTETKIASTLDFAGHVDVQISGQVVFSALLSGEINCVRLENLVQLVPGVNFHTSDSLLPITFVPLRRSVFVQAGQTLALNFSYSHRSALSEAAFEVEVMSL